MNTRIPPAATLEPGELLAGAAPLLFPVLCRVLLTVSPAPFKPLFPGAGGQSLGDSGSPGCS